MKNLPVFLKVFLVGVAAIMLSLIIKHPMMLFGGCGTILLSIGLGLKGYIERAGLLNNRYYYPSFVAIIIGGYLVIAAVSLSL